MNGKTVSILGCGWLGKPLGEVLVKEGFLVKGSTTTASKIQDLGEAGIQGYLFSFTPQLQGERGDFFDSHTLILSIPPKKKAGDPRFYFQQIEEVVKECLTGGVRKIIFISSTSVYPDLNKEVTEQDNTLSEEESVLIKAENYIKRHKEFSTVIARFAGLVGPGRHPGRFLANKKNLPGGNLPVNLIHLDDCIEILLKITLDLKVNGIFNACSDVHPVRAEFYRRAANSLGLIPPEFLEEAKESFKIINSEKLKQKFGFRFKYPDPSFMFE